MQSVNCRVPSQLHNRISHRQLAGPPVKDSQLCNKGLIDMDIGLCGLLNAHH